jgi:hypothetical protein
MELKAFFYLAWMMTSQYFYRFVKKSKFLSKKTQYTWVHPLAEPKQVED